MIFKNRWTMLCALLLCAGVIVAILERPSSGEGREVQTVRLNIKPLANSPEPGPAMLIGAESQPGGYKFAWVDVTAKGAGDCRVYFDFKDKDQFHFMDRKGSAVTLGLREAGVEQVFSTGTLASGVDEL